MCMFYFSTGTVDRKQCYYYYMIVIFLLVSSDGFKVPALVTLYNYELFVVCLMVLKIVKFEDIWCGSGTIMLAKDLLWALC